MMLCDDTLIYSLSLSLKVQVDERMDEQMDGMEVHGWVIGVTVQGSEREWVGYRKEAWIGSAIR